MALTLPNFAVFRHQKLATFLQLEIHDEEDERGILKCDGKDITSALVKFAIEDAKVGDGLVHIRCCRTNRYLVARTKGKYENVIVAAAKTPENDPSKDSCTLFRTLGKTVMYYNDEEHPFIKLFHVSSKCYVKMLFDNGPYHSCLLACSLEIPDKNEAMEVYDWDSLVIMPKYVAFKDVDGNYLSASGGHLRFASKDKNDLVAFEITHQMRTNYISIKSYFDEQRHWYREEELGSNRISLGGQYQDEIIWPVKTNHKGAIAFLVRDKSNKSRVFCSRSANDNFLEYGQKSITKDTTFVVEELVLSRSIYDVEFHLLNARIFNQIVQAMATGDAINTSNEVNEEEITIKFTETKSSSWKANVSGGFGVETTLETGIPLIAKGEIKISAHFEGGYEWGSTKESSTEISRTYKIKVPQRTRVIDTLLATKGTCEIPFSYTKRDELFNGRKEIKKMIDGVYTGVNSYNFKHEVKEEKL